MTSQVIFQIVVEPSLKDLNILNVFFRIPMTTDGLMVSLIFRLILKANSDQLIQTVLVGWHVWVVGWTGALEGKVCAWSRCSW